MKPKNDKNGKARFFANSVEAVFFWLVLGGLILFGLISVFRYKSLRTIVQEYNAWDETLRPFSLQIKQLKSESDVLRNRQAALESTLVIVENTTKELRKQLPPLPPDQIMTIDSPTVIIDLPEF